MAKQVPMKSPSINDCWKQFRSSSRTVITLPCSLS